MSNVKEIKPQPNQTVIRMLKDALELAESGEIQSLVMLGVRSDACTFNVFCADWHPIALLGELRVTERELIDECVDIRRRPADWAIE